MSTVGRINRSSFTSAVGVIARREITTKLQSKGFVIPTLITLAVIILGAVIGPKLGDMFSSTDEVAVTAEDQAVVDDLGEGYKAVVVDDAAEVRSNVEEGEVDAGIVSTQTSDENPIGLEVFAEGSEPTELVAALSVAPEVTLLDADSAHPAVAYMIALAFGLVFMMTAITFGTTIAQSVVEEKQTRLVEIILAAVPARAILAGKVLGTSLLAFAQVALYAIAGLIGLAINGAELNLDGLAMPIIWFVVLFTVAFITLAALYGAAAALVSRQEDIGSATTPLMMLIMIPYFAIIFFQDNPVVLTVMSYIPFSAPVAVPMRTFLGDAALWENLLSLAILVVAAVVAIKVASVIYERSILKMGKMVKWSQALKKADA